MMAPFPGVATGEKLPKIKEKKQLKLGSRCLEIWSRR
jgi:hypothetical protein